MTSVYLSVHRQEGSDLRKRLILNSPGVVSRLRGSLEARFSGENRCSKRELYAGKRGNDIVFEGFSHCASRNRLISANSTSKTAR